MEGQLGSDATLVRGAGASALAHSPTSLPLGLVGQEDK